MALSDADLTMHRTSDIKIEDEIDGLTNKLAALCFERLEEDLRLGYGGDVMNMGIDQSAFDEELRVRVLTAIRGEQKLISLMGADYNDCNTRGGDHGSEGNSGLGAAVPSIPRASY